MLVENPPCPAAKALRVIMVRAAETHSRSVLKAYELAYLGPYLTLLPSAGS